MDAGADGGGRWGLTELFDVGPAGPATATAAGIVMVAGTVPMPLIT